MRMSMCVYIYIHTHTVSFDPVELFKGFVILGVLVLRVLWNFRADLGTE